VPRFLWRLRFVITPLARVLTPLMPKSNPVANVPYIAEAPFSTIGADLTATYLAFVPTVFNPLLTAGIALSLVERIDFKIDLR
jgi:hypothetical protein